MSRVVLDDHLLRDLLSGRLSRALRSTLAHHEAATTNLYYFRLCRSIHAAAGGQLTGSWTAERRAELGRSLADLPADVLVVPMRAVSFRMAELAAGHRLSSLGAEAVAAAEYLAAPLLVWSGDDGPQIRAASHSVGVPYRALAR